MEEREHLTETESMLRDIAGNAYRSIAAYQWAIGGLLAILFFSLGSQCTGERLSATVIESKTRITNLENRFNDMQGKLDYLVNNAATKNDLNSMKR
jgi:hypothetical protein